MADPLQLSDLRTALRFLVGDLNGDVANIDYALNKGYLKLGTIKGYWRLRSFDYTSTSSPALTDGTYQYALPTSAAASFDAVFRLYYRRAGRYIDVPIVDDDEWLYRSRVASTDKGYPRYARLFQTATQKQLETTPRVQSGFITSIGTLTIEYFIQLVRLSAASDEPLLPANLRDYIIDVAGLYYAMAQGDTTLISALRPEAEKAYLAVLKHDITRTGRPRQLRPKRGYEAVRYGTAYDPFYDYGGSPLESY